MTNRYLSENLTTDQAFERLKKDATSCLDACNPVALSLLLSDAMVFLSRSGMDHQTISSRPEVQLILTQLTYITSGQNVASDEAWSWLFANTQTWIQK